MFPDSITLGGALWPLKAQPLRSHALDLLIKRIHFLTAPLGPGLLIVGAQLFQRFLHGKFRCFGHGYSQCLGVMDGKVTCLRIAVPGSAL
jgi:hypothetical protein